MLDKATVTAGDLMTRDVIAVHPETSLLQAVKLMASHRISGLPVVDDGGHVVGMMTEGDLVRWHEGYTEKQSRWLEMLAEGEQVGSSFVQAIHAERHKVKAAMSPNVTMVTEVTPAREIASLMHAKNIKRVPVLRDGKLVGIVARSDLVRALAQKLSDSLPGSDADLQSLNEALRHAREETLSPSTQAKKPQT